MKNGTKTAIITITERDNKEEVEINIEFKPPISPALNLSARDYYVAKFIQVLKEEDPDFVEIKEAEL